MYLYKDFLLDSNYELYQSSILSYACSLGYNNTGDDKYSPINFLQHLKESDCFGYGKDERAKYYLRDFAGTVWFRHVYDAIMYAHIMDNTPFNAVAFGNQGIENNGDALFDKFNGTVVLGFEWIKAYNIDNVPSIADRQQVLYCIGNGCIGIRFNTVEEAAEWLVHNSRASSAAIACRQIRRNLNNETNLCYGYKFSWR